MKHKKTFILAALVAVLLTASGFQPSPECKILFEKAKFTMETKGDLNRAINLFNDIIKKYPNEREYAAKSQLYIGLCYEKSGVKEAQKAYQKVVDSYPEQTEAVKLANEKLSLLLRGESIAGKENKEFKVRQVWASLSDEKFGAASPDGKYLSFAEWNASNGDLSIYEIATGKKSRLTNVGSSGEFAEYPRWSPDGKQIVYDWVNKNGDELRIIGLDGSNPRIIYHSEEVSSIRPFDWSPDGKQILARFEIKDGTSQIVLVSTADGSVHVLKPIEKGWPTNMNFSPDSRYIVYDFLQKGDSPGSDISLLSTDGNREIPIVEHPADDYVLGWTPDGKNILFTSNRKGNKDIWAIQVSDGKPQGDPNLVKQDIGQFRPMGFTRDGSFYYRTGGLNIFDVYTATIDPITSKILVPQEKAVKRFEGYNQFPSYSPDGKKMVYISIRSSVSLGDGKSAVLCIRSLETGKEREFPLNYLNIINIIASPRWSPDGRSIIIGGQKENRWLIIRIDAQTGDITPVVRREDGDLITSFDWSRDGEAVFYGYFNPKTKICQIIFRNLESGAEKVLLSVPFPEIPIISLSPGGRSLALLNMAQERVLKVMSVAGGEPRELFTWDQPYRQWGSITWSADGKYILFSRHREEKKAWDVCRISVEGGEPQNLGLTVTGWGIRHLSVHPDGRHIAWSAMTESGSTDPSVWVMENFLPK